MVKKIVYALWALLVVGILAAIFMFYSVTKGWIGFVPPVEELENPDYKFATQIISADGKLLSTYSYSRENRVWTDYKDLSPKLIEALISTEDVRSTEHSGIDLRALLRAIVKTGLLRQSGSGGGSTLTQQLAKQLYTEVAGNKLERLFQKPIEWVIAVKLEKYYTKEEILTIYLNKYDFGNNAIGIKTAANTYFSKEPKDLSVEEAATLVGMCKNSSLYNPVRRNETTRKRRNVVLSQMEKNNCLTKAETDSLQNTPLVLNYRRVDHKLGPAPYFREYLRGVLTAKEPVKKNYRGWQMQKYYEDSLDWANNPLFGWCNKNKKKDGSNYNLYTDGLKIYVTLDSRMQQYAEEAVDEHIKEYLQPRFFKSKRGHRNAPYDNLKPAEIENLLVRAMKQTDRYRGMKKAGYSDAAIRDTFNVKYPMRVFAYTGSRDTIMSPMDSIRYYKHFLRVGFMSMDPITGYVKAYVGGPDYTHFQYDMAMVGRRQVGSTVKPFLYALAMERGFTPCDETLNVPQTLYDERNRPWRPRNAGGGHVGEWVSLRWGLSMSNNWISAWLINQLGPYSLKKLIHNFGLSDQAITPSLSLCLGTCDASVSEMVSAYTAFIGKGMRVAPLYVTSIEDNMGNQIASFSAYKNEVISRASSYRIIDMMRGVVNIGTARSLRTKYGI